MEKVFANLARPDSSRGFGDIFFKHIFDTIQKIRVDGNVPEVVHIRIPDKWTRHFFLNFRVCDMCEKTNHRHGESKMLCCNKCKIAHYCSIQCQKMHWEEHRSTCSEISADEEVWGKMIWISRFKKSLPTLLQRSICWKVGDVEKSFSVEHTCVHQRGTNGKIPHKKSLLGRALKQGQHDGDTYIFYASDNADGATPGLSMAVCKRKELLRACEDLFRWIMMELKSKDKNKDCFKEYAKILSESVKHTTKELEENCVLIAFAMKEGPVVWGRIDCE